MNYDVVIYYDVYGEKDKMVCSWKNIGGIQTGLVYLNHKTGKITKSNGEDIIRNETECVPHFIVGGNKEITDDFTERILLYLNKNYIQRNTKKFVREFKINKILK